MDGKRVKLSGFEYKQKRLKKQEDARKQRTVMDAFLVKNVCPGVPSLPSTSSADPKPSCSNVDSKDDGTVPLLSPPEEESIDETQMMEVEQPDNKTNTPEDQLEPGNSDSDRQLTSTFSEISSDPAFWNVSHIPSATRQILVENGPVQIKEYKFPVNKNRRRFSSLHYARTLTNGDVIERIWLIYSVAKDAVFCFCCILFDNSSSSANDWPKKGYSDWGNLTRALTMHEKSNNHRKAFRAWKELDTRLKQKKTIDAEYQRITNLEVQHWRAVLKRILSVIRLLASQCLAFRGTDEHLFQANNGNFLKCVELLAEFDPIMEEHVRRIQRASDKWSVTYLSNNIQDELINLMGKAVLNKIIELTKGAKYFSIIADCTPDVSHVEQLSLTVRIVSLVTREKKYGIHEFFIGFFEAGDSTGEGLTELILAHLKNLNFELKWLRGQGYDNGANMKGIRKGVQNRILENYPRAFYVPCACHSLNLAVNDAASSTVETTKFFSIVQELYNFFAGSTKRWDVLKMHVTHLTLKPLSATRWSSRIDALKPLRYELCEIYDALLEIVEDVHRDSESRMKAKGLAKNIKNYKFICGVILWYDTLFEINSISKLLQSVTVNLFDCVRMLSEAIGKIENYRNSGYNHLKVAANEIADNLECDKEFPTENEVRSRRKKRQFDEQAADEPLSEEQKFKINFFNYILDITLNSLNERFKLLDSHSKNFQFLYDISKIKHVDEKTLEQSCINLELILTDQTESDLNANDLMEELCDVSRMLPHSKGPLDVLNYLCENDLILLYPNTTIALRILLTLPVSVASGERSFSKMKLIKNYLRNSISQMKLKNLSIISIEAMLAASIDYTDLIHDFAKLKVRRVPLH